jgi:hypothetical protein
MTVLEALAILEAAVLECKKRNINTPEVRKALDLLAPCIPPEWVMSQFRFNTLPGGFASNEADGDAQQQALRATFPGIRDSVRELLGKRMDALAREFGASHDMEVKDEIERLAREYAKLNEPWVFRP